jgi:hypothetical protein
MNRPILVGEMDQNNQKIVYFHGLLRAFGHPTNGPKKVLKGLQVDRMYGPMS